MIALVGIIIKSEEVVAKVNELLHDFRGHIVGRMGLPLGEKGNIISIVLDSEPAKVNALTGKLGSLDGVKAKALYGN